MPVVMFYAETVVSQAKIVIVGVIPPWLPSEVRKPVSLVKKITGTIALLSYLKSDQTSGSM